jgi:hypothetical protein
MRRKVLKNTAHTICHMFRGWQLLGDYRTLTELGSGPLEIDVLSGQCQHRASPIPRLSIAEVLHSWLLEDLARHHILLDAIREVSLAVDLTIDRHDGQRNLQQVWAHPTMEFVGCELTARSRVLTDEATYTAELQDTIEWPLTGAA